MEQTSLISEINKLLETQEWESTKVSSLLIRIRDHLSLLDPSSVKATAIKVDDKYKISKLTDLIEFEQSGWSLVIENSISNLKLYLLEEKIQRTHSIDRAVNFNSLVDILDNLENFTSKTLSYGELQIALKQLKRIILCCSSWRHESICLQIEKTLKIPSISWINPAFALLLAHIEQIDPLPTLVIWSGDTITEFAFLNLPNDKKTLSFSVSQNGMIQYGQESLIQDLFCYLIYPQWESLISRTLPRLHIEPAKTGQADSTIRGILKAQLESHPLGSLLLKSTFLAQDILQDNEFFSSQLQGQVWEIKRSDYYTKVVFPYLEYLKVSMEDMLKISLAEVKQVVWGGKLLESIHLSSLPWARQNFKDAKFYSGMNLDYAINNILNYPALFI